jgi:hypothetical protein
MQHVANLRELELAISHTGRLARAEIASKDPQQSLRSLLRLYSFLVGAWAETRLRKLLHEEFGFSEAERNQIEKKSSQLEQWQETVDLAFRKHHSVKKAPLDERSLGVAHAARRAALQDVLTNELRIIIEIRNKLAHGQWVYPFNNEGTAVEPEKYKLINKENLQSLQFKYALSGHLAADASRPHYGAADKQSAWLLGASRRTTTRIKPTSAVKAFGFSVLAAYPPPR